MDRRNPPPLEGTLEHHQFRTLRVDQTVPELSAGGARGRRPCDIVADGYNDWTPLPGNCARESDVGGEMVGAVLVPAFHPAAFQNHRIGGEQRESCGAVPGGERRMITLHRLHHGSGVGRRSRHLCVEMARSEYDREDEGASDEGPMPDKEGVHVARSRLKIVKNTTAPTATAKPHELETTPTPLPSAALFAPTSLQTARKPSVIHPEKVPEHKSDGGKATEENENFGSVHALTP